MGEESAGAVDTGLDVHVGDSTFARQQQGQESPLLLDQHPGRLAAVAGEGEQPAGDHSELDTGVGEGLLELGNGLLPPGHR